MIRLKLLPAYDADVAIAGAGPGGAAAAAHLARAGLRVLLLDQRRFPRDKVCGDFVSPMALAELATLGVNGSPGYQATNQIWQAALFLDGKRLLSRPFPAVPHLPSYGRVIPRLQLDDRIVAAARNAGAVLLEGQRVTGYSLEEGAVCVESEGSGGRRRLRTRVLIGADGSSSVVARQLRGHGLDARDRIVALRAYYEGTDGPGDRADLYFTQDSFPGYYWLFPTGAESANVGVGVALNTVPRSAVELRELLQDLVQTDPALRHRLRRARLVGKVVGWPLATFNPRLQLFDERVVLIGDAANLINPLNGEGIQTALLSARWAAQVLIACAAQDDFSAEALRPYGELVERELRYDMALACFIVQCIRNRSLNPVWLRLLRTIAERARKDRAYAEIAGGILAGVVPAQSALSVRLVGGTLSQAAFSAGTGLLKTLLGGPREVANVGLDTARLGFTTAYDALSSPGDLFGWALDTAADAGELLGQVSRHAAR